MTPEIEQLREALAWGVEWIERWEGETMPEWREWAERGRAALAASEGADHDQPQ